MCILKVFLHGTPPERRLVGRPGIRHKPLGATRPKEVQPRSQGLDLNEISNASNGKRNVEKRLPTCTCVNGTSAQRMNNLYMSLLWAFWKSLTPCKGLQKQQSSNSWDPSKHLKQLVCLARSWLKTCWRENATINLILNIWENVGREKTFLYHLISYKNM